MAPQYLRLVRTHTTEQCIPSFLGFGRVSLCDAWEFSNYASVIFICSVLIFATICVLHIAVSFGSVIVLFVVWGNRYPVSGDVLWMLFPSFVAVSKLAYLKWTESILAVFLFAVCLLCLMIKAFVPVVCQQRRVFQGKFVACVGEFC